MASEADLQNWSNHFTVNCCSAAAAALLVFDYALTFEQEVDYIWSSSNYGYVLVFFANRLAMLGMAVGSVLNMLPWYSTMSCTAVNWSLAAFQILALFLWAIVSTLRVYAVSNRDWGFTILTLCLGLTPVVTNLYANIAAAFFPVYSFAYTYCGGSTYYSEDVANRACLIASDSLVLFIAWYQLHTGFYNSARPGVRSTLTTFLLRDGTLYFVYVRLCLSCTGSDPVSRVLLVLNVAQVITDIDIGVFFNPLPSFSNPYVASHRLMR
ncbi:uncharacterized protein B0H18DRAFT_1008520 [Fomitopsis serialis]|uniref:uncharacterized protein n=1 Tax=Fomitopsis serialis TaxID=139415 RepID=UPI0020087360|nr:uncharacterized protein B0H18DRAFT_1008520 [Neoantrodia serialis]KAH9925816.1 hypothetical protein B0H18DRAFT_1008520 [Neoantrodia serialis]